MANMLPWVMAQGKTFWMPEQASTVAEKVDFSFYLVLWISVFFAVGITLAMVYFVIKYRARTDGKELEGKTAGHSTALELTWTIIPTVIVLVIFYDGFRAYMDMAVPPANAYEIQVNAKTWSWDFTYPNGHNNPNELHVPLGRPVLLVLSSADVIHSFFVPQFRVKKDVVPGRFNKVWFEATTAGTYDLYCTEYCGRDHSEMRAKVVVHEQADFDKWLESASKITGTPLEIGKRHYELRCAQCHRLDSAATQGGGPGWKNVFGYPRQLAGGGSVVADENYLRDSILYPAKDVVAGFGPNMPSFQGVLKEADLNGLIAFIKAQSDRAPAEPAATQPQGPATRPNP